MQKALFAISSSPSDSPTATNVWSNLAGRTPRPYQGEAILNAFEQLDGGSRGTLLRAPTGTGKSFMAALACREWLSRGDDYRVMVCLHDITLVNQMARELRKFLNTWVGVEQASRHVNMKTGCQIVVGSRASLAIREVEDKDKLEVSRLSKFDPHKYKWLLIPDEAHRWRWNLPSCKPIVEHFDQSPHNKRLGLTATPERSDKAKFDKLFPSVCLDMTHSIGVDQGWIVDYRQKWVNLKGVTIKNVESLKKQRDLDKAFDELLTDTKYLRGIVKPVIEQSEGRRILVFCPDVRSSYAVAAEINKQYEEMGLISGQEIAARAVHGEVKKDVRENIYDGHKRGDFQFLVVCGLCVARGTLVLTDHGEVPIEDVTTKMKVWDGVEFVSHDGVICKGNRPVIEYAGLRATENHNVWTATGWKSLADCKSDETPIAVSGIGGSPIREIEGYYRNGSSCWKSESCWTRSGVRRLRKDYDEGFERTQIGSGGLQELLKEVGSSSLVTVSLSCSLPEMHEHELQGLYGVRSEGNRDEIRVINGDGSLGDGESGIAQREITGPNRQQRSLRTWEYPLRNGRPASEQQTPQAVGEEAEVYDILNAGPRHRFTANGLLVSNCREGYDDPGLGGVAILRAVKSRSLAEQMKGRVARVLPGTVDGLASAEERKAAIATSEKPDGLIIDIAGVTGLGAVPSTAEILAQGKPDDVIARVKRKVKEAEEKGETVSPSEIIEEAEAEYKSAIEETEKIRAKLRSEIQTEVEYSTHIVRNGQGGASNTQGFNKKRKKGDATPKQVDYLVALGISREKAETFSKKQAGKVIDERKKLTGGAFRITFGKHKGKSLNQVPEKYLSMMEWQHEVDGKYANIIPHIKQMEKEPDLPNLQSDHAWESEFDGGTFSSFKPPTEAQIRLAERFGYPTPQSFEDGAAIVAMINNR